MLNNTRIKGSSKVGMLVGYGPGLVSDGVEDVLQAAFA
jgi:hypothetical protein